MARHPRRLRRCAVALATVLWLCGSGFAQGNAPAVPAPATAQTTARPLNPASTQRITTLDADAALAYSQSVLGQSIPDVALLTVDGRPLRLHELRGKPLLVNFMYSGCFQVCPTLSRNLQKALEGSIARLGMESFTVVSIGFNQPFDTPAALAAFTHQHGLRLPNWLFLSPAPALVPELTEAFGFQFVQTTAGFDHLNQITLVDAQGRIVRQLYGTQFDADMLVEPLRALIAHKALPSPSRPLAELVDKVLLLCSKYDPLSGKYRLDYRIFFEGAGAATFVFTLLWFGWSERRKRRGA